VQGDAEVFHLVGQHLADGNGFRQAFRDLPTAEHPPLWELVLAGADLVGANGFLSHRLLGGLIGTVTVVLIGLLARRLAGNAVGLVAAGIAALYPMLWAADTSLMSESLYGALLVAALLAATSWRR
jgi:4-amino-4-deoxy-L-arabinose transferase-like glycosyltransferase